VFDKVPEPPPHGTPGLDRITVLEDTNHDGVYDTSKDVITGLSIATSVQVGPDGIWVLNPPYLLFYPDADGDDVPDGDPEVHLSGFGLQDTHSVANSLLWGPDGWLYGANGSTTIGTVSSQVTKGVGFEGQCIWRYHPTTKVFEIFAEGGGNTFSLEIDSKGRVFSGTNGGGMRGYYYPQGSYADKNWGKHGPLTNPYAFGYFGSMKMQGDPRRFAQAFSIYEGGLFPDEYAGTIVAPNALHNLVWNSELLPDGSTYRTVDKENLLESSDRWFRPVYSGVGPDGAIYLADWYDTRLSHVSPIDDWHKTSGRIYRIRPTDTTLAYTSGNLHELSSRELIAKFQDPNKWVRRRAMLELGWRGDRSDLDMLIHLVDDHASLESLWAINLLNELTAARAATWLRHEDADVRRWVVRLLGDRHEGHPEMVRLAADESDIQVRSQLASTAKRVDAETGLAIVRQLVRRDEDRTDPHLPLMVWWALEAHADDWPALERLLTDKSFWETPIVREVLLGRLMQRYAARGTPQDLTRCDQLIRLAPDKAAREILIVGLNQAFQGRAIPKLPRQLDEALAQYQASLGKVGAVLALRSGRPDAVSDAVKMLGDNSTETAIRIALANAFSELKHAEAVDALLRLATGQGSREPALQRVAIGALANYDDPRIPTQLAGRLYDAISAEHNLRATACRTLASRKAWAQVLLTEINQWRLKTKDVPEDVIQQLRTYDDPELAAAVEQAFGKAVAISTPEKAAEIQRLSSVLSVWSGNPEAGKAHFAEHCGKCHKLFGEGQTIGPPLDGYERGSLKFWLNAIIEPSLEIREGFQSYKAITNDGRLVTGMIEAQDPNTVTIRTADTKQVVLAREEIEGLQAIKTSLMPEKLFAELTDQQIKDLMAYLSLGAR
jgi:putative heme-binding domain-containing protein